MATNRILAKQILGFYPKTVATPSTLALNAASTWLGFSFVPEASLTLAEVSIFVSAIAGTLAASDLTMSLYNDSGSGFPASGAAVETHSPASAATAGTWMRATGFATALTAGTPYWIVIKNANATPASNNFTVRYPASGGGPWVLGDNGGFYGWANARTTTGDGGWGTRNTLAIALRLKYADGSYAGYPVQNAANSADLVYSTRESGLKFTMPPNSKVNAAGILCDIGPLTGTPAGGARFGFWKGSPPVNLGYTWTIPEALIAASGGGWMQAMFVDGSGNRVDYILSAGDIVRITLAEASNSDTSANAYKMLEYTWDSDTNSLLLVPFEGTAGKTYFNGSTWTDTPNVLVPMALILDDAGEFAFQARGGFF
jgi:hypothetical protein